MKKTIFLAAMISAFSITSTFAQDAPPKEKKEQGERKGGQRGNMYEDLNLSQDQKDKMKTIDDEQKTKYQTLRDDKSLSDDARKEKMMELRKARMEKVNGILTPEQKTKMEAKMKERRSRGDKEKK
ncbi:Spy/CpxP family protein refolding chaperone [Niabella ginsengisoli]|uniref:Spy/CpxP family protein refolding chaperone n=1 Tax=Niabella ginsengisoli TaxID=522298 RepID=A0ABS9SEK4_9BACT|nr:Spy/CpxP family protein refolding chaperone [Niabella ginsengisoli]MCH5596773.1 Spy/CpxP family protein refolding chaperone [Niabella ginsengisoli]